MILLFLLGVSPGRPLLLQGNYRLASERARAALVDQPDSAALHTTLAHAQARLGRYGTALDHFDAAAGDPLYERAGVALHADVLRSVGRPDAAAALREPLVLQDADPAGVWVDLAQDHLAAGDVAEAWRAVERAQGWRVDCSTLSMQGVLHLAQGDVDQAEAALWLAQRQGRCPLRAQLTADLEPDPLVRAVGLAAARQAWPLDPELAVRAVDAWQAAGQPDRACAALTTGPLRRSEHVGLWAPRLGRCLPDAQL